MSNAQLYVSAQTDRVFTLLVDSQPVLAFEAARLTEARQLCKESWLLEDLRQLKSNGAALLTGTPKITVRAATPEEATVYADVAANARLPEGELVLAYLVDLDNEVTAA